MRRIALVFDGVTVTADLLDTPTADAIWDALPLTAQVSTWGEEVYFDCGVTCAEESDARTEMQFGEIAYWPPGEAIAIGFGRTPASVADEIRLASPSNVWANSAEDLRSLASVGAGSTVTVSRTD